MEVESWMTVYLTGAFCVLFTLYYWCQFTKLRRCGIPGPTPLPLFGNTLQQISMGTHKSDDVWIKEYGKVVGVYTGHDMEVVVTDADVLKRVLVKDFSSFVNRQPNIPVPEILQNSLLLMRDEQWRTTRNIMSPSFTCGKIKQMINIINTCAEKLVSNLVKEAETSGPKALKEIFGKFSIDVIASAAFGLDIDSQNQPDEPFVRHVRKILDVDPTSFSKLQNVLSGFPGLRVAMMRLGISGFPSESLRFFEKTSLAIMEDRKKNPPRRVDLLQLLMNAEQPSPTGKNGASDHMLKDNTSWRKSKTVHRLSNELITSQTLFFFLAGYETVSSLLRYATYKLALRPDIDEKLMEEIKIVVGDRDPTYEDIGNLKYMEMFINETLRFYPPTSRLTRQTTKDFELGTMKIPQGAVVIVPVQTVHRDPDYFPEPDVFRPERFSSENKVNINPVTFIPFGYGPRTCIGMRLSLFEAKLALVHMLRKLRFVKTEETEVPLKLKTSGILRPQNPVRIGLELRM